MISKSKGRFKRDRTCDNRWKCYGRRELKFKVHPDSKWTGKESKDYKKRGSTDAKLKGL